jgi:hypothetical protein
MSDYKRAMLLLDLFPKANVQIADKGYMTVIPFERL